MNHKVRIVIYMLFSGLFLFVIDQVLKYIARTNADFTYYLWKPWIGWEYFANTGIAFSLPVPNWLVILITPLVILLLLFWFIKSFNHISHITYHISLVMIVVGALSNYLDRLFFGATTDYLRLFTGVINLADVMIVGGVALMIVESYKVKSL